MRKKSTAARTTNSISSRLLISSSFSALAMGASALPAWAQCTQTGTDIVCSGTTNGRQFFQQDGISVLVEVDAIVDGSGDEEAIRTFGNGNTVTNQGTITTDVDNRHAALMSGEDSVFVNSGDVLATGSGFADGVAVSANTGAVSVTNTADGTITSNNVGIFTYVGDNGEITIQNDGTVTAHANSTFTGSGSGITARLGNIRTPVGSGTINITNSATGTVVSEEPFGSGVYFELLDGQANINNAGSISGYRGINSEVGNANAAVTNSGTIASSQSGVYLNSNRAGTSGSSSLNNSGTITATSGTGVLFALGQSGTRTGTIINTGSIEAENDGVNITSSGTGGITIENSGTISSNTRSGIRIVGNGNVFNLNNAGTISGVSGNFTDGIRTDGTIDQVINSGSVTGGIDLNDLDDRLEIIGANAALSGTIDGGSGNDELLFIGTDGFQFADLITGFETVSIQSGDVTFDAATIGGVTDFTILSDGIMNVSGATTTLTTNGGLINQGELNIAPGATLAINGGAYTAETGATTVFGVDTEFAQITASGDIDFASGSQIEVDVRDENVLVNGLSFDAAIAGGVLTDATGDIIDNSALFDFLKQVVNGNTLEITMQQVLQLEEAVSANDPNALAVAEALQAIVDSGSADGATLITALGQIQDADQVAIAIDSFGPGDSGGGALSEVETIDSLFEIIRRESLDPTTRSRLWSDITFSTLDLDDSGPLGGYSTDAASFIVGLDLPSSEGAAFNFGLGYSYSDNRAEQTRGQLEISDQNAHTLFTYFNNTQGNWHLSGSGGVGFGQAEITRLVQVLGETLQAERDFKTLFGRMELARASTGDLWTVSPLAGLQAINVDMDSYRETGGISALSVGGVDLTSWRSDLGVRAERSAPNEAWTLYSYGLLSYEFGDTDEAITSQFVTGGSEFSTGLNARDDLSVAIGGAFSFSPADSNFSFGFGYDGELAGDFTRHTGSISLSVRF